VRGIFLAFLVLAFESFDAFCADGSVFGPSSFDSFAPHVKGAAFHVLAHDCPHLIFFDAVLHFDGIKRRSIFPSHLNNAVHGFHVQVTWRFVLQIFGVEWEHERATKSMERCFMTGELRCSQDGND